MSTAHLKLISKDLTNIISLSDAKAHLRIPAGLTDQDALITSCTNAAIRFGETRTDRVIAPTVYQIRIEAKAATIILPIPDFQEVTKVEAVIPGEATNQVLFNKIGPVGTLEDYVEVDSWLNPAELTVIEDDIPDGSTYLILTASFGMGSSLPQDLTNAMKMMLSHFFDNPREVEIGRIATQVPMGADTIFGFYTYKAFS
jgi:hypothetical protein